MCTGPATLLPSLGLNSDSFFFLCQLVRLFCGWRLETLDEGCWARFAQQLQRPKPRSRSRSRYKRRSGQNRNPRTSGYLASLFFPPTSVATFSFSSLAPLASNGMPHRRRLTALSLSALKCSTASRSAFRKSSEYMTIRCQPSTSYKNGSANHVAECSHRKTEMQWFDFSLAGLYLFMGVAVVEKKDCKGVAQTFFSPPSFHHLVEEVVGVGCANIVGAQCSN